jgi:hypothetical protein
MLLRTLAVVLLFAALPAWAQTAASPQCTVDVGVTAGPVLDVTYRCRSTAAVTFAADDGTVAAHVQDLRDGAGNKPAASGDGWAIQPVNGVAEVRYRYDLAAYANEANSTSTAMRRGEGVVSGLSGWLLETRGLGAAPVIDIRAHTAAGLSFATGMPKVGDGWRLANTSVGFAGYTAIGKLSLQEIAVPAPGSLRPGQPRQEGVLRLAILDGVSDSGRADLTDWVKRTAEAESNYWQGFTAPTALLTLIPTASRQGVGFGRTVSGGGATVAIEIGTTVDERRLFNEWVLVHELIHTGMPYVNGRGTWLMEGAATYVEPIIRARAGWKSEDEVWHEWMMNMPRGAAAFGDGLATGGQPYWAGAIFMLLSDIGIRKATGGAKGLEDCLGGVLWSGMDARGRISVPDFARACDRAVGTNVFSTMVDQHLRKQSPIDLAALWKDLGVGMVDGRVTLDDSAPQARWRKMIVMGPPGHPPRPVKLPWQS